MTARGSAKHSLISPEFGSLSDSNRNGLSDSGLSDNDCGDTLNGMDARNLLKTKGNSMHDSIHAFLNGGTFAVAGASTDPAKFGNLVFKALVKSGRTTFPLNPQSARVEGHAAYPSVADLPEPADSLAIITPPAITKQIVQQAIACSVKHLWIQPGAQHPEATTAALAAGLTVVDDGSCLLLVLEDEV